MTWHRPDRPAIHALIVAGLLSGAVAWIRLAIARLAGWR